MYRTNGSRETEGLYLCPQIHAHTVVYTHMKETISSSRKGRPMLLCARCVLAETRPHYLHWGEWVGDGDRYFVQWTQPGGRPYSFGWYKHFKCSVFVKHICTHIHTYTHLFWMWGGRPGFGEPAVLPILALAVRGRGLSGGSTGWCDSGGGVFAVRETKKRITLSL